MMVQFFCFFNLAIHVNQSMARYNSLYLFEGHLFWLKENRTLVLKIFIFLERKKIFKK